MKRIATRQNARSITAEDLLRLQLPSAPAMAPDERWVAYTVERMDREDNRYYANIWVADLATGVSTQYTHGKWNDARPVWSHAGDQIAFLSTRDKKTGLYLMPAAGGAERKVLEIEGSVSDVQWTLDDCHLVFALQYSDSHFIEDEKKKQEPPVYRHITRFMYRLDGVGFLPTRPTQIFSLDLETGHLRQITKGKRHNQNPHVSPDGRWIAYVSNRSRDEDLLDKYMDLFIIPFEGGKERRVPTPAGPVHSPKFSPDGKLIAYLGHDNPEDGWEVTNLHVWCVGRIGKPAARDITAGFDRDVMDVTIGDTEDTHFGAKIEWSADGKRVFFLASDTGATNLFSVPVRGGKPTRLYKGSCRLSSFSVSGRTKLTALLYADLRTPGAIVVSPTSWEGERRARTLTDLNPFLRTEIRMAETREVWIKSFDGTEIQGFLVKPPDFKTGKRYPAILEIHGGPRGQYGFTFFHEMHYLAAHGYVVLYTNPRGGAGRGETWKEAIAHAAWGDLDYKDCMAAADWLEKQSFVNPKKLGVTGGSYGGYMTNWIIGHTDRFKAAVTQRSVVDLRSFTGSSDVGFSLHGEFGGWAWANPEGYERCSPITYFKNVKTPVLILHSEKDLRCNIEQAEQMFVMLKALGKKVEMVRFPDEPHGLSRHGRPDRRLARLNWIRTWFDRYLR